MMLSYSKPAPPPPPFHERCMVLDPGKLEGRIAWLEARGDYVLAAELRQDVLACFSLPRVKGPQMAVVCGWCKKALGSKPCAPEQAHLVSTGICPACAAKMEEGL